MKSWKLKANQEVEFGSQSKKGSWKRKLYYLTSAARCVMIKNSVKFFSEILEGA